MTEHILNFSIGVDDDSIIRAVQAGAEKQIIADIKEEVLNKLFSSKRYGNKAVKHNKLTQMPEVDRDSELSDFAAEIVRAALKECKDDIIDAAADKLVESVKRSKAWKEKVEDTL